MNDNFKVGYKVICVDDLNTKMLTKGDKYTIVSIENSKTCGIKYLTFKEMSHMIGLNGQKRYRFGSRRFIVDLNEVRKQKLLNICQVNQEI